MASTHPLKCAALTAEGIATMREVGRVYGLEPNAAALLATVDKLERELDAQRVYARALEKAADHLAFLAPSLDCRCSLKERESGHLSDCFVPDLRDALDNLAAALASNPGKNA